jgi:cytochrome P450
MDDAGPLFVDETAPGYFADPYPHYAPIRAGNPVHHDPRGPWMVFGYDDVVRVLRGPGISSRLAHAPGTPRTRRLIEAWGPGIVTSPHLSRADPPEHTRLRRVLAAAFTPRHMEARRPRIREIVGELLDGAGDEIEIGAQLARPLPYRVMCELLGYPPGTDDTLMIECTHAFVVATMEPFIDDARLGSVVEANKLLTEQIREAVRWKRRHLGDDLMPLLLAAEDGRAALSEDEVVEQVRLLFAAGHETTVNAVELALLALLRHRDQWELLVDRPELAGNAVEELLRYDNTIQIAWRTTPDEFALSTGTVPAGNDVVGWIGSANRDPARWGPTADRLDITRADAGDHLSFGSGLHLCLGAWLARAEMQELLAILAARYPAMDLAHDGIRWEPLVSVRGPERLDLRLRG